MTGESEGLEVRDARLHDMVEGGGLTRIETGFGFTEGPIWHHGQQYLIFSDIQESRQYRWSAADGLVVFRAPSNQANGNVFDAAGRVISCEHASSQVVRHEHDGKLVRVLASHYRGRELNSPNDVVVDREGAIYFTDPTFGRIREDLGVRRETELNFQGVYRLDPDGGGPHLLVDDFEQPNGLCFSRDQRRLFVNDTRAGHIRVFDMTADKGVTNGTVWAVVEGDGEGVPDGMKVDSEDNVYCNGPGGVHVFAGAERACLGVIRTPEKSTNFAFGGDDLRDLYICASTSVYRARVKVPGHPV